MGKMARHHFEEGDRLQPTMEVGIERGVFLRWRSS